MPAAFVEDPSLYFGVSSAAIDTARSVLAQGGSLGTLLASSTEHGSLAPLIPIATRIAAFQHDLDSVVRSAAHADVPQEAVDALLAVALTVSERFPEVR
jgi:hypothetical protein